MKIDRKDSETLGRLIVPFTLAIFLALLLEDVWDEMLFEHQIAVIVLLIFTLPLIYRKKVRELMR